MAEVGVEVDAGVGAECSGPGETLGVEAEPVLSLDGALVRRSGRIPAVQRICSSAEGVAALGFGRLQMRGDAGGPREVLIGRRSALGVRAGERDPR